MDKEVKAACGRNGELQMNTGVTLTLDELRKIGDCDIWICYKQATFGGGFPISCSHYRFSLPEYGNTWLAYRRKPNT